MTGGDEKSQDRVSGDTSMLCSSQELVKPHQENPFPRRMKGDSSSTNYFHILLLRERGQKGTDEFSFMFRDNYHVQAFHHLENSDIIDTVLAGEKLFVIYQYNTIEYSGSVIVPYNTQHCSMQRRGPTGLILRWKINYVCYNSNNVSLIVVKEREDFRKIVSFEISSIKAERSTNLSECRDLFPGESDISHWDFDISNCRGIIHNINEKVFKVLELKEYELLFTIRDEGGEGYLASDLGFLGPGNMEMLIPYEKNTLGPNVEIPIRIYSKRNGYLRKETWLPIDPGRDIEFLVLCGTTERILVQQSQERMKIIDIGSDDTKIIKITDIHAACRPYYLDKRRKFVCYTRSMNLYVCNLQGEILVTFEDHRLCRPNLFKNSYVTNAQNVLISVCSGWQHLCTINASSIFTGKCLAKITTPDISDSVEEDIRKIALTFPIKGFVFDEKRDEFFTINKRVICRWSDELCSDTFREPDIPSSEEDVQPDNMSSEEDVDEDG